MIPVGVRGRLVIRSGGTGTARPGPCTKRRTDCEMSSKEDFLSFRTSAARLLCASLLLPVFMGHNALRQAVFPS